MEEPPSRMTKDAMLKALGQAITDVQEEVSEINQSIGRKGHHRYDLIREENKADLLEVVNYYIARGWVPLGGVTIEPDASGRTFYLQAIWLPESPETDPFVLQQEDRTR